MQLFKIKLGNIMKTCRYVRKYIFYNPNKAKTRQFKKIGLVQEN